MRSLPGALLYLPLLLLSAGHPAAAQPAPAPPARAVRYHFGDDPDGSKGWANANFDDSSWPVGQKDNWPRPAFYSDGFVWVRILVPVRSDTAEPLALRVGSLSHVLIADEVFVNGKRVGSFGRVPPGPYVEGLPREAIFDLQPGLARPGTVAHVALRIWYPPFARRAGKFDSAALTFDQSRTLYAEKVAASQRALLNHVLPIIFNILIVLVGIAVLWLARSSRNPDLILYGTMLVAHPWFGLFFEVLDARLVTLSVAEVFLFEVITQLPGMIVTVEFIWRINHLSDAWFKGFAYASTALFNLALLAAFVPAKPSALVSVGLVGNVIAVQIFSVLTILANLWVIFVKRKRRLIAFAMLLVPVSALGFHFADTFQGEANLRGEEYFLLAFLGSTLFLTAILAHQAWKEWRARDALQSEFETAREMQQRLVPPAVDVPGFRIESVYKPAAHVGGDFFYIRPLEQGGILVVVGDVSGKGLKAAMTVNLVIGALRTMPPLPPTRILAALNRGLVGQMQGGFVTCCAVRIDQDGAMTIANAGHLSPYHDGVELPVIAGVPLGIDSSIDYEESQFLLAPGSSLTFVSDGIVEARNEAGELFGFERTLQLSNSGANAIAQAAQAYGQEDDITVLSLTFTGAEVPHA